MPSNKTLNSPTMIPSAIRALWAFEALKIGVPFETASTPVIAVQPLEKARTSSHKLTVAPPSTGGISGGASTGVVSPSSTLTSPIATTVSKDIAKT